MRGGRGFALEYRRSGARITALWLANESVAEGQGQLPPGGTVPPRTVRVSLPVSSRRVTVIGYLGGRRTLATRGGRVSLEVGAGPVYVLDAQRRSGRPGGGGRPGVQRPPRFTG